MNSSPQRVAVRPASVWLQPKLAGWANYLWARFGGAPVYLHGSSLTRSDPRDVDVTVVLRNTFFHNRYGTEAWVGIHSTNGPGLCEGLKRMYREAAGLTHRMQVHVPLPLDFKIVCEAVDEGYRGQPRVRLDEFEEVPPG